ncbi:hypothetical protein Vi05172_g122 [Venturia inaequalis]|nr:hypothetical protein Vi05172_g122 [Venturia inaequalis]
MSHLSDNDSEPDSLGRPSAGPDVEFTPGTKDASENRLTPVPMHRAAGSKPSLDLEEVTVLASTGPVYTVKGPKAIVVYNISFWKTVKAPESVEVVSQALKQQLFGKVCEINRFKKGFKYDRDPVHFDGKKTLYSRASACPNEKRHLFCIAYKNFTYEVLIERRDDSFVPEQVYSTDENSLKNLGGLLRMACNNVPLTGFNKSLDLTQGLDATPSTLTSLKGSQHLAIKAVKSYTVPDGSLLDFVKQFCSILSPDNGFAISEQGLKSVVLGLKVSGTIKQMAEGHEYLIIGVGQCPKYQQVFKVSDKTVSDYFKDYTPIKHPDLPVLNIVDLTEQGSPLWVPLEMLSVKRQKFSRKVYPSMEPDLLSRPRLDEFSINPKLLELISARVGEHLKPFDISLELKNPDSWVIRATPMPGYKGVGTSVPPTGSSRFAEKGYWKSFPSQKDETVTQNKTFHIVEQVHIRTVLDLHPGRSSKSLKTSLENYTDTINRWFPESQKSAADHTIYRANVRNLDRLMVPEQGPLLVMLPNNNPLQFSRLKLWADCAVGTQTVCAIHKNDALAIHHPEQLAMKINHHAGGQNYKIQGLTQDLRKCMIVGIGVSRVTDRPSDHCNSIASVVASSDDLFLNYPGSMRFQVQDKKDKSIPELKEMVAECLATWKKNNNDTNPNHIIVYRTGISSNDYAGLYLQELEDIEKATKTDTTVPEITMLLVEKNQKTKFFRESKKVSDPGLYVLDQTDRGRDSFYLQSHGAAQPKETTAQKLHPGSTHYTIFHANEEPAPVDEDKHRAGIEKMVRFTNNLCWNTVHSTSALSYVSPAYYADRLCERGLVYLKPFTAGQLTWEALQLYFNMSEDKKNPWHRKLDGKMFYI